MREHPPGTDEPIAFISDPPGAQVVMTNGYACPATPCSLKVERSDEFDATFSKAGCQTQIVPVRTKLANAGAAGFAGNIIAGGVIGMGVDAATGASYDHVPNPVQVTLVPEALPSAQRAAKRPRVPQS